MKRKGCFLIVVIFLLLFVGYRLYYNYYFRVLYIQSINASQFITVFTSVESRFVVPGKHTSLPSKTYIKLHRLSSSRYGDAIYICWKNTKGWEMVIPKTLIIENNLDTVLYTFSEHLPVKGEYKIPTMEKFKNDTCVVYDFYLGKHVGDNAYGEDGQSIWIWNK